MNQRHHRNEETGRNIDLTAIIRFCILALLYSAIIYGMKYIVLTAIKMSPTGQVGNNTLTLYEVHNTGAAFSLFQGQPEMLIMASFLTVAAIVFGVIMLSGRLTQPNLSALAFLSSGIFMNMLERIQHGYVIDYIHCNFLNGFPVFNIADIMIVFGALGLILSLLSRK